jgi:hypothetical protein
VSALQTKSATSKPFTAKQRAEFRSAIIQLTKQVRQLELQIRKVKAIGNTASFRIP